MKIIMGSDHGGFDLKEELKAFIETEMRFEVQDEGCYSTDSVDYPDIAVKVCNKVIEEKTLGILICGTGIGMSMAANKMSGIRCALCSETYSATMTRKHNDANVLALGGRVTGPELAKAVVKAFLKTDFEGGRHERRVNKINELH